MCKVSRRMRFQRSTKHATAAVLPDDKIESIEFFNCNFKAAPIPETKCERNLQRIRKDHSQNGPNGQERMDLNEPSQLVALGPKEREQKRQELQSNSPNRAGGI